MPLSDAPPVGFIPTRNADAARSFYQDTLGLQFVADEPFALVFRVGAAPGSLLRLVRIGNHTASSFTIFGWEVSDLQRHVDELTGKGVTFLRFPGMEQDERAIWHAPGRAKIVWFQDPDGNTLSLSEHFA